MTTDTLSPIASILSIIKNPSIPLLPLKYAPAVVHRQLLPRLLNNILKSQLDEGDFDFIDSRVLEVRLSDLDFSVGVTLKNGLFAVVDDYQNYDAQISGTLEPFLKILMQKSDPDTLFFKREIIIQGDTELGLGVKNILDTLEFEQLPASVQWLIKTYQRVYFPTL